MVEGSIDALRIEVENLHYAVMKISGKHFLKVNRVLVETVKMDENGMIWATTRDTLPKILINPKGFNVQLRYANKGQEKYLQVEGKAFIEEYSERISDQADDHKVVFTNSNNVMIRVEISRAEYFTRKNVSRYTSFLQSIWTLSFGKLIHSGHGTSHKGIA